jgi:hypothetical protein
MTLFQQWKATHDPCFQGERRPQRLVLMHCTAVADGVPCSLDGTRWGEMRTRMGRILPRREFVLDRGPDWPGQVHEIGAGFDPEHVFITEDVYSMVTGIRAEVE